MLILMEKFQLYRTALDALQFLCLTELGFSQDRVIVLQRLYGDVLDSLDKILTGSVEKRFK